MGGNLEVFDYEGYKALKQSLGDNPHFKAKQFFIAHGDKRSAWADTREALQAKLQRWLAESWEPRGAPTEHISPDRKERLHVQEMGKFICRPLTEEERLHMLGSPWFGA